MLCVNSKRMTPSSKVSLLMICTMFVGVAHDMLENSDVLTKTRDLVIPPSDPLIHYYGSLLREKFGYGSAYLVFHREEPVAAFKANTRVGVIQITDFVGDSDLEKEALRVMKEFAWEHDMPLKGKLYERLRSR